MERPDIEGLKEEGSYGRSKRWKEVDATFDYALLLEQTVAKGYLEEQRKDEHIVDLEAARDFLEQKLERITKRLEEIDAEGQRGGLQWTQIARIELAQELLEELNR